MGKKNNDPLSVIEIKGLPWPPSVNHMYSFSRKTGRQYLQQRAKDYHWMVLAKVNSQVSFTKRPLTQRLHLDIYAYPPDDNRRRDLDNILKIMLDSLQHSKVFADDGQIDRFMVERRTPQTDPYIDLRIEEYQKVRLTKRTR